MRSKSVRAQGDHEEVLGWLRVAVIVGGVTAHREAYGRAIGGDVEGRERPGRLVKF